MAKRNVNPRQGYGDTSVTPIAEEPTSAPTESFLKPRLGPKYTEECEPSQPGCAYLVVTVDGPRCLDVGKEAFFGTLFNLRSQEVKVGEAGKGCGCDVPLYYTRDLNYLNVAHAVIFSSLEVQLPSCLSSMRGKQPKRPPGQKWITISMEPGSGSIYKNNQRPIFERLRKDHGIDVHMSNDEWSDIPITHMSNQYLGNFQGKDFFAPATGGIGLRKPKVFALYTNCVLGKGSERNALLGELIKRFSVDSYGECHNNAKHKLATKTGSISKDAENKIVLMSEYMFSFSMDNTDDEYNVSEKIWQSLLAGTIPIYWGPPIAHLLPCENCVINVADFNVPKGSNHLSKPSLAQVATNLATELKSVLSDKQKLEALTKWRTGEYVVGKRPGFDKFMSQSIDAMHCKVIQLLQDKQGSCKPCGDACREQNIDSPNVKWRFDPSTTTSPMHASVAPSV